MADNINAAGYETKPWWPYVRALMEGGGSVTVEQLNVTENGTYTAESGKAYSPVVVNVPGGVEGFSTITCTAVLNDGVEVLNLSVLPYFLENDFTVTNCMIYDTALGGFNSEGTSTFSEESLTANYIYMKDYAYFSVETEGVSYEVTGDAEKITIEIGGVSGTAIKASGDFTITASALS